MPSRFQAQLDHLAVLKARDTNIPSTKTYRINSSTQSAIKLNIRSGKSMHDALPDFVVCRESEGIDFTYANYLG